MRFNSKEYNKTYYLKNKELILKRALRRYYFLHPNAKKRDEKPLPKKEFAKFIMQSIFLFGLFASTPSFKSENKQYIGASVTLSTDSYHVSDQQACGQNDCGKETQ